MDPWDRSLYHRRPPRLSGGGGLVSTMADYHRFVRMLERGGELDGVRLLGPRTVHYMASNHLPDGRDLNDMGQVGFAEVAMEGMGFGLGFSVSLRSAERRVGKECVSTLRCRGSPYTKKKNNK